MYSYKDPIGNYTTWVVLYTGSQFIHAKFIQAIGDDGKEKDKLEEDFKEFLENYHSSWLTYYGKRAINRSKASLLVSSRSDEKDRPYPLKGMKWFLTWHPNPDVMELVSSSYSDDYYSNYYDSTNDIVKISCSNMAKCG